MYILTNHLTHYNLLLLLINSYYINLYNLYAINTCLSWIILITFNSTILIDKTSFKRLRKKFNYTYVEFHIGNFILHTLPCIYTYKYPPILLEYKHTIAALLIEFLWCYISSNRTMDLTYQYVKLYNKKYWNILYFISITSGLSIPIIYNNYIFLN